MRLTAVRLTAVLLPATVLLSAMVLLPATVLLPAGGVGTAPAYAVDPGRGLAGFCPDATGVTVVVDFHELGGSTITRCAPGAQATGLAALKNAGIQITGTARWGEAFICRIEGKPGPDSEPCIDTPSASAYWSYWYSTNGGAWTYSQLGVTSRTPPPGSFEGWSFSKGRTATTSPPPGVAPVRPARPAPARTTAPGSPPGGSTGGRPSQGDQGRTTGGAAPVGPTAPAPGGQPAPTTGSPVPVPASSGATGGPGSPAEPSGPAAAAPATGAPVNRAGDQPAAGSGGGGVPVATLVGAGLLVALIGGAAWTAYRRRAADGLPPAGD